MSKEEKKIKKKSPKKRDSKYQKKISLYGMEEKRVLKEFLESPPMGKEKNLNKSI